jgi:hypothetical protein
MKKVLLLSVLLFSFFLTPISAFADHKIVHAPYNAKYYEGKTFKIISIGLWSQGNWHLQMETVEGESLLEVVVDKRPNSSDLLKMEGTSLVKVAGEKVSKKPAPPVEPIAPAKRRGYAEKIKPDTDAQSHMGRPSTITKINRENGNVDLELDDGKVIYIEVYDVGKLRVCDRVRIEKDMLLVKISDNVEKTIPTSEKPSDPAAEIKAWQSSLECYMSKPLIITEIGMEPFVARRMEKTFGVKLEAEGVGIIFKIDVDSASKLRVGDRVMFDDDKMLFVLSSHKK